MAAIPDAVVYPQGREPPRHVLEGVFQGVTELSTGAWHGMQSAIRMPLQCAAAEGLYGAGKGLVFGTLTFTESLADGLFDLASCAVEGARNTPEALMDFASGEDRIHYRHVVDAQEGRMLETYLRRQPQHLPDGVALGTTALSNGLAGGASSFVERNVEAFNDLNYFTETPARLGKGMLQGLTGITAKLASSSLDFTEAVVDGARNTPDYIRSEVYPRLRQIPPRIPSVSFDAVARTAHKVGEVERAAMGQARNLWHSQPLGAPSMPRQPVPAQELPLAGTRRDFAGAAPVPSRRCSGHSEPSVPSFGMAAQEPLLPLADSRRASAEMVPTPSRRSSGLDSESSRRDSELQPAEQPARPCEGTAPGPPCGAAQTPEVPAQALRLAPALAPPPAAAVALAASAKPDAATAATADSAPPATAAAALRPDTAAPDVQAGDALSDVTVTSLDRSSVVPPPGEIFPWPARKYSEASSAGLSAALKV